jgi:hypothetical protein
MIPVYVFTFGVLVPFPAQLAFNSVVPHPPHCACRLHPHLDTAAQPQANNLKNAEEKNLQGELVLVVRAESASHLVMAKSRYYYDSNYTFLD